MLVFKILAFFRRILLGTADFPFCTEEFAETTILKLFLCNSIEIMFCARSANSFRREMQIRRLSQGSLIFISFYSFFVNFQLIFFR